MTFFKVNERQYIEIFPEKTSKTDRLNHISIETDDAEAMRVYLGSKGLTVPAKVGKGADRQFEFQRQGSGGPYGRDRPV